MSTLNESQLHLEHGFEVRTLFKEFLNKFFLNIESKVGVEDFSHTVDTGVYFALGQLYQGTNYDCIFTTVRYIGAADFLSRARVGVDLEEFPFILVVTNKPGTLINFHQQYRIDLSKAYQFRHSLYDVPLYVLCEDEHSLAKNEFLKKH